MQNANKNMKKVWFSFAKVVEEKLLSFRLAKSPLLLFRRVMNVKIR